MAFDLNKNDESNKGSSIKTPASSKFDLSKGKTPDPVSKSKTWAIGLLAVLVIGCGIWYYEIVPSNPIVPSTQAKANTVVAVADTTITTSSATPKAMEKSIAKADPADSDQNVSNGSRTAIAALNHKIPATFAQGSSSLMSENQPLIKSIISYLTNNPSASINVDGYASSDGSLEINQTISQARADAFKNYLVSKNIEESRVTASGKGIENPIASNKSSAGRKKNRRIEITFP